jgi:hypothetical protein
MMEGNLLFMLVDILEEDVLINLRTAWAYTLEERQKIFVFMVFPGGFHFRMRSYRISILRVPVFTS